jgi:hypothetical protein
MQDDTAGTLTYTPTSATNDSGRVGDYENFVADSEATIKQDGSYSLKLSANTLALGDTLVKTFGRKPNLSGRSTLYINARCSRLGDNLGLTLTNEDGFEITTTISVDVINTWEVFEVDLTSIPDAYRGRIETLTFEVLDASSTTIWYIDNIYGGD